MKVLWRIVAILGPLASGLLIGHFALPPEPIIEKVVVEKIVTQLCSYPQPPPAQDIVGIDEAIVYLTYARDTHWYFLTERTPPGYPVDPGREKEWVKRYQAIINLLESMRNWYPYETATQE